MRSRRIWYASIGVTVLFAGACKNSEQERATRAAVQHDSATTAANAELERQKDSLLVSVRGLFEAMSSIDSAATLAGVKKRSHTGEPIVPYPEAVRARTVRALKHLKVVERRLHASLAKVKKLDGENAQLNAQLASFRDMAASLQAQVTAQQARADSLVQQLVLVRGERDSLSTRTHVLTASLDSMVTERQKVFVVVGTKNDLEKKAIVEEVGGTRFPWIFKVGATLRPTNKPPSDSLFQAYDMMAERTIQLDPKKRYEVISTQDLLGADRSNARGRVFQGSISITDPQKFWHPSPYLILRVL